jgi:hypothetical protein
MQKHSRSLLLWLVLPASLLVLAVTGLAPSPEGGGRLAQSDCIRAKQKDRQRHDWGWNVFNNRTERSGRIG